MFAFFVTSLAAVVSPAVDATTAPKVIATAPRNGQSIPSGKFELRVTFDQPMQPGGQSLVRADGYAFPQCDPVAAISSDRRSYTWKCVAESGRMYQISFNSARYGNFKNVAGVSAIPYQLRFTTSP